MTMMNEKEESSMDQDDGQVDELSMEEILRRQSLRNVLRPAATRLKSGLSEQSSEFASH